MTLATNARSIGPFLLAALLALIELLRPAMARRSGEPFEAWLAVALGGLAAVAMLWEALPALWMRPCD